MLETARRRAYHDPRAMRGVEMCLDKRMTDTEALLTLATAFQRYRVTAEPGWTPRHRYRMSMTVRGGVPVHLAPR